jgi:hypothetical protein
MTFGKRCTTTPGAQPTFARSHLDSLEEFAEALGRLQRSREQARVSGVDGASADVGPMPIRLNADQENVEQGLAKLVLSLVELLRQLLEKQALRRMDAGDLSEDEIERLGTTFLKLQQRMTELKSMFGLDHESLDIDLGPLGHLIEEERKPRPIVGETKRREEM